MILMSITAGGTTFYVTDIANGVTYNGQWYDPWILDTTDISWGGGAFASLQLGSVSLITGKTNDNGDSLKDIQSYIEWDVTLKWTDYDLTTVTDIFTGVAILRDKNQFTFELKFKTEDFRNENYNLLTPAPNLIINGGEYQGTFVDNTAISVTGEELRVSFALGSTFLAPLHNQSIIDTTVSITNTTKSVSLVEDTDFTLDYASGVITVSDTTDVDDGDVLSIDYDYSKYLSNAVVYSSGVYYQNTKTDGGHSVSPPTSPWSAISSSTVFSDGRVYPIAFGELCDINGNYTLTQGFFARPLLMNQTKYLYWSAYGDPQKVFDDGVEVTFNKLADGTFQLDQRPVGDISMYIDGTTTIVEEIITGKARKLQTTTYHQDTEPSPNDYDLILGDIWYDTSTDIQYKWNGQAWDIIIEEVKKVIKGSSIEYGAPDTGLNISQDYLGYYSGSTWTVYIKNDGDFYFGGDAEHYISWDGSTLLTNGIQMIPNGTNSTATRLTIVGGTAPSTGLTASTRLDFTPTQDGKTYFYKFLYDSGSGTYGWVPVVEIGDSTTSTSYESFIYVDAGISNTGIFAKHTKTSGTIKSGAAIRAESNFCNSVEAISSGSGYGILSESASTGVFTSGGSSGIWAIGGSYGTNGGVGGVFQGGTGGDIQLIGSSSAPSNPGNGVIYFNTSDGHFYGYNGTTWKQLDN